MADMARSAIQLALCTAVLAGASFARADDIAPPPWRLSLPSATVQEWDFVSPGTVLPDGSIWGSGGGGYVNPFGPPTLAPGSGAAWLSSMGGPPMSIGLRTGVWELDPAEALFFEIPNSGTPGRLKDIRVQVTWWSTFAPAPPPPFVEVTALATPFVIAAGPTTILPDGWAHTYYDITLPFCPPFETFKIYNPGAPKYWIDQVVIDTLCRPVPEPMTLAGLGMGAAALVARRRRRA